jgi:hypothetical protein
MRGFLSNHQECIFDVIKTKGDKKREMRFIEFLNLISAIENNDIRNQCVQNITFINEEINSSFILGVNSRLYSLDNYIFELLLVHH